MASAGNENVVVFQDGDTIIAQRLDIDIAAQGRCTEEALRRLSVVTMIETQTAAEFGLSLTDIGPAPQRYHDIANG